MSEFFLNYATTSLGIHKLNHTACNHYSLSATESLRKDHEQIRRLEKVIVKCYNVLYEEKPVPLEDLERIVRIIEEFLDSIHYSREEDSYFPCVASYDHLKTEIKNLMIEHEFSRRVARQLTRHLALWRQGVSQREPVARFLRTYSIYLDDHMNKEEALFDEAESQVLSREEEQEMFEQFKSVMAVTAKMSEMVKEIEFLEGRPWFKD